MASRPYTDPDEEAAYVARSRQAWDKVLAARNTVSRADAQSVSTLSANYPHMSPGTVIPLAQAGVGADDPLASHVATEEAKSNQKKRGFWGAIGDIVQGGLSGAMFLPELGMGVVRNVAAAGGDIAAGAVSGAATGAAAGLIGAGPTAGLSVLAGTVGGALIGGGLGGLAQARGVKVESGGFVNPLEQTTLGQDIFYGKSQGEGLLPGGTAVVAQQEASRRSAAISGHALTPGRFLASSVTEPGTKPYNLLSGTMDAAVAWELDPVNMVGKANKALKFREARFLPSEGELARRVAQAERNDAGLVDAARKTVIGEKVDTWLGTKKAEQAKQWFAGHGFEDIRKQLGGDKVDVAIVRDLADATTPEAVDGILRQHLGIAGGMEVKPAVGGFGMEVRRKAAGLPFFDKVKESRLWSDLPSGRIDYADPTDATHQFELLARDANIPTEQLNGVTRQFADALLEGTFEGKRKADAIIYKTLGGAEGKVSQSKAGRQFMNKVLARAGAKDNDVLRALIDEDAMKMPSENVSISGKTHNMVSASYLTDYMDSGLDVDRTTLRGIRAATSKVARIANNPKFQAGVALGDHITNDMFKPAALLRGAWTVRVVGEEQIRMAAAGRLSLFNHPLSYLAWAMDDEGRITDIFKKHGINIGGRGQVDIAGERFAKEGSTIIPASDALEADLLDAGHSHFGETVNYKQKAEAWAGDGFTAAGHQQTYVRGAVGHVEAVAENIDNIAADPLMRMLATEPRYVVRRWFMEGDGNEIRQALITKYGAPLRSNAEIDKALDNARGTINKVMGRVEEVKVPANVPGYPGMAKTTAAGRPGSPAIRDAIATGELNGVPIRDAKGRINSDFVTELNKLGEELPDQIVGSAARADAKWATKRDSAIQSLFTHLMTKPSAKLSRSPMFRQTYWDEAKNLMTELDPAAQAKLLDSAAAAKLPKADIDALRLRARASSGELTLHEGDMLAKGRALDATQTLLYDAAKRGQISDVLRIVMPFAEAQKEVMGVWAKVGLVDNPAVLRRAQQVMSGARGSGMFYKDPTTGEEMFAMPGGEFATGLLGLQGVPLVGRVQGLNMFGNGIMPGIGPAMQIPAKMLLEDKPQFDGLMKFIDPYGATSPEGGGLLEQLYPSWVKKGITAFSKSPESDRTFANTVKDVWAQGISTGKYKADTQDDIQKGLDDAKFRARGLYFLRSLSSVTGVAPTTLSPEIKAKDKDGKWIVADRLKDDLQKMLKADPDGANKAFLEKYGNNAFAFLQSKSYSTVAAAATTTDASAWLKANPGVVKKYGDVAGLFAPQGGEFDYAQYLKNLKSGDTVSMTIEEYAQSANDKLAKMIFYEQKDKFGPRPSKSQRAWLTDLRMALREEYPGFDKHLPGKPDQGTVKDEFIPQIEKAVKDPKLADNKVAQATATYLQGREAAIKQAKAAGFETFTQARSAQPLREWLRQLGDQLISEVPDFEPMMSRIFDREMVDDQQVAVSA